MHHETGPAPAPESAPDQSEWRLVEEVFDAVRDYAMFVLDPRGRIRTWNAGA